MALTGTAMVDDERVKASVEKRERNLWVTKLMMIGLIGGAEYN